MHGDARRCNLVALFAAREELEAQLEERGALPLRANLGEEIDHGRVEFPLLWIAHWTGRCIPRESLGSAPFAVAGVQLRAAAQEEAHHTNLWSLGSHVESRHSRSPELVDAIESGPMVN